jgi:hypothetical protein
MPNSCNLLLSFEAGAWSSIAVMTVCVTAAYWLGAARRKPKVEQEDGKVRPDHHFTLKR